MNLSSIRNFKSGILEVECIKMQSEIQSSIKQQLISWTNKNWDVIIKHSAKIEPFKAFLISQVSNEKWFTLIKRSFSDVVIEDLILDIL